MSLLLFVRRTPLRALAPRVSQAQRTLSAAATPPTPEKVTEGGESFPFSDIKLTAGADGSRYGVHKGMLATHSRVFAAQLAADASKTEIVLEGKTKSDLELLVTFLYHGKPLAGTPLASTKALAGMARDFQIPSLLSDIDVHLCSEAAGGRLLNEVDEERDVTGELRRSMTNLNAARTWRDAFRVARSFKLPLFSRLIMNKAIQLKNDFAKLVLVEYLSSDFA